MTKQVELIGHRVSQRECLPSVSKGGRGRSGIRSARELQAAMAHLSAAFRELDSVSRILDFQRVDEVHITADSDWADLWLKPRLKKIQMDNSHTLFCINGVGEIPIRLGGADCEIWFGEDRGGDTEALLFRDYLVPASSPENTKRIFGSAFAEML